MINLKKEKVVKLKQAIEYATVTAGLLVENEKVLDAYKSGKDGVAFTTKRLIVVNTKGLSGKRHNFTSIPYNRIEAFSVNTVGNFQSNCSMELYVNAFGKISFAFLGKSNVRQISQFIAQESFKNGTNF